MNAHEDWLLRPVMAGMCRYESLLNGTLSFLDMQRMNDALDVRAENDARAYEASKRGQ